MARIRSIKPEFWTKAGDVWPHGSSLYVIQERRKGPIKVGIAEHPIRRLSALQCGNPRQITLRAIYCGSRTDCKFIENAILFLFSPHVILNEWIDLPLETILEAANSFTGGEA